MLRAKGAPKLDRGFLLALTYSQQRVDVRQSMVVMQGVEDALSGVVPVKYFDALCDDPEEAVAMFNLHKSRTEFRNSQPAEPISEG